MAEDVSHDIPELMARADTSLSAAQLLIDHDYFAEAVSRAYYAMFYAATALLHTEDVSVAKHSAVIALVGQRSRLFVGSYGRFAKTRLRR
jgi:uncharacterized protein (UPF0332 family)